MSLSRKLSTDILTTTLIKFSLKIRGIVLIPLLTLFLGAAEYGAYVQVFAVATLLGQITALGLDTGIVQFIQQYSDKKSTAYWTVSTVMLLTGLIATIAIAATAPLLAEYTLGTTEFTMAFLIGAALVPLTIGFRLGQGYLRATRRIKLYSITDAAEVYLHVAAVIAVVFLTDWGIAGVIAAIVLTRSLVVIAIHTAIIWEIGFSLPSIERIQIYLNYSLPTMGTDVARSTLTRMDRILVGFFLGASAVGVYSVAYQVSYTLMMYVRPLSIALFPEFSRLWKNDSEQVRSLTIFGLRYFLALGIPSIGGFWLIGDDVLNLLTTSEVAASAAPILVVLCIGIFFEGISEIYTQLFYAAGTTRIPMLIQIGAAISNILLNIVLIPTFGVMGAALTTVITYGIAAGIIVIGFQNWLRVVPSTRAVVTPIVATGVMLLSFWIIDFSWIVTLLLAPVLYSVVFVLSGGINQTELRAVAERISG